MPLSYVQFAGTGTTGPFSVPFPYLLKGHVKLYRGLDLLTGAYSQLLVDGADYTWLGATQVQLASALANGTTLTIRRETPTSTRLVDWSDGSNVNAADMDIADLQNFYAVQDQQDRNEAVTASQIATAANAQAALNAVNAALPYVAVGTVAGIPAGANGARIEVANSTGIESFSPLAGRPAGFVGSSQIRVRLTYTTAGSTWNWVDYAVADPDGRYVQRSSISDSTSNTSSTTVASSTAVKTAKDAADTAQATAANAASAASTAQATAANAASAASTAQERADRAPALMTAQASTSGTSIDFTGIPNWAKRITLMFSGVSTNGASPYQVQVGANGFTTSGYNSNSTSASTQVSTASASSGFIVFTGSIATACSGHMLLTMISGNTWISSSTFRDRNTNTVFGGGDVTLSGALDRIRITTTNGTDAFDAGTINVMYE